MRTSASCITLTKAYTADDDHAYVEGIATGTEMNLPEEGMSVAALASMVGRLKANIREHNDNKLVYKAKSDPGYATARDLVHAIQLDRQSGLSIGAQIVKAGLERPEEIASPSTLTSSWPLKKSPPLPPPSDAAGSTRSPDHSIGTLSLCLSPHTHTFTARIGLRARRDPARS